MFGMSFAEVIVIAVIAVIFLGPDKLPDAMVKFAKYFKMLKQTVNSAKSTFENEVKIAELKEDAKRFRDDLSQTSSNLRKKLTFEELDSLKKTAQNAANLANENLESIKKQIKSPIDVLNNDEINTNPNLTNENSSNLEKNPSNLELNLGQNLGQNSSNLDQISTQNPSNLANTPNKNEEKSNV